MIKYTKGILFLVTIILFTGCTHKITITPEINNVKKGIEKKEIHNYNVGYYLSEIDKEKYVVTAGGGGDKIGYYPYKELEIGFRSILLDNFKKVYKVKTLNDMDYLKNKDIKFIFTYKLNTTSSSESMMTWPPTNFSVLLDCKAIDSSGNKIWEDNVSGMGAASFSEFKSDFSLAGKRASEDALKKMFKKIQDSNKF